MQMDGVATSVNPPSSTTTTTETGDDGEPFGRRAYCHGAGGDKLSLGRGRGFTQACIAPHPSNAPSTHYNRELCKFHPIVHLLFLKTIKAARWGVDVFFSVIYFVSPELAW